MSNLQEKLTAIDRNIVIEDTVRLIDNEVASKSGLSGMAIKGGYKAVKKLKKGRMIHKAVNILLDDFTSALSPLHDGYREQDPVKAKTFEAYLLQNDKQASQALLTITDTKIKQAENKIIISTYKKLRGQAEKHVTDALPGVGRMIDKHVPVTFEN